MDALTTNMMQMFHSDCITFHLIQGFPWHIKVVESRSFKPTHHSLSEDKHYPELYKDSYYHQSPLLKEAASSSKLILKLSESICLSDWERSDMYNRFIAPQNLYWEMFLALRWKNNLEGMITLWRGKDQGDYEDSDILKAGLLAPHLMVASRNVTTAEWVAHQKRGSLTIQNTANEGLLLLDHRLKPLYFNAKARRICLRLNNPVESDGLNETDSEFNIPDCITQDCTSLLNLVKTNENPILWPKERIMISPGGQRFRLETSLIWKADQLKSQPNYIVILDEDTLEQNTGLDAQTRYKLSKREMDIIYYLNQALSDNEIAEKLFISKQTVHTHVKNIYRKLGAKKRIELYRYIQSPIWLK